MTLYLTLEETLVLAAAGTGAPAQIRDLGLIESALARPQTTIFGQDVYPTLEQKAAALLLSLVGNGGLIAGNERLAFMCTSVFLALNGQPLALADVDEAYDLVVAVATGQLADIDATAAALRSHS